MANKSKFFSWFGRGKKKDEAESQDLQEQAQQDTSEPQQDAEQSNVPPTPEAAVESESEVKAEAPEQLVESEPKPVDEKVEAAPQVSQAEVNAEPPVENEPEDSEAKQPEVVEAEPAEEVKAQEEASAEAEPESAAEPEPEKKQGFFARLKKGLAKTKANLGSGIANLFRGKKIDDELFEELETQLLVADVGVETSLKLVEQLTDHADRNQLKDAEALYDLLKQEMAELLKPVDQPLVIENSDGPFVILMVGVNGVGKTTTIGKMAKQFQQQGKSVMLAAGDTFRAAAVEQLIVWGERNDIPVVAQHTGADSASVIFDAIQSAKSRNIDVIIADTAGRLQNKDHLMEELKKIVRVMKKLDVNAPHEVMLTLDAGTGQNALSQVKLFSEAVGLTGLTLSKLDGTAKGGVLFAIADKFSIPIRYIGVGEGIDDLRAFNSKDFIEALFAHEQEESES